MQRRRVKPVFAKECVPLCLLCRIAESKWTYTEASDCETLRNTLHRAKFTEARFNFAQLNRVVDKVGTCTKVQYPTLIERSILSLKLQNHPRALRFRRANTVNYSLYLPDQLEPGNLGQHEGRPELLKAACFSPHPRRAQQVVAGLELEETYSSLAI